MKKLIEQIKRVFNDRFGDDFILIKSPGRVNLIGEHTDYNEGFVLPAAVDRNIILAMAPNNSTEARFYAVDKREYFQANISDQIEKSEKGWANYLLGVADQLKKHGYQISGFDCVFGGDVPIGSGMSSSAALEGGVLRGLKNLFNLDIPPLEMARIAQKAENDFVGVQCGIMDQFVSLHGKKDHALMLDCRSLEHELHPFDRDDICIVLCDTQVRRELASSEYNLRRTQCEEAVNILQQIDPEIKSLRDVSFEFLIKHEDELNPTVFRRCKFVIEENKRVTLACRDLQNGNFKTFGQRMYQSHAGLQLEYEVSCEELDILVNLSRGIKGVFGARMMGGGFGGCTINLVEEEYLQSFQDQIAAGYLEKTGSEVKIYQTKISGGSHVIDQEPSSVR